MLGRDESDMGGDSFTNYQHLELGKYHAGVQQQNHSF
jgi:hypothetical protein